MIKISSSNLDLILKNQIKSFSGVVSSSWGVKNQVRDHFANDKSVNFHYQNLMRYLPLNKRAEILDLGCGYGLMLVKFLKEGYKARGCDSDRESIIIAKKILKENGLDPNFASQSNERLPYPNNSFDFIYIKYVLVYVKDLNSFFREIKRVLKPGGSVYLITPNYQCCYDTNYGLFLIPFLPRRLNMFYLKLRGKQAGFFKDLSLTTKCHLEKIFKKNQFEAKNIGLEEWFEMFDNQDFYGRSAALKKIIFFMKKFHLQFLFESLAKIGFYTPLVYILKKKSKIEK